MWGLALAIVTLTAHVKGQNLPNPSPRSGNELVSTVLDNCVDMPCVKQNVLGYLDNVLKIQSDRNIKVIIQVVGFTCFLETLFVIEHRRCYLHEGRQSFQNP